MNLRQLTCFVAVVDEGSFTRAARAIGIAQPSLSQHIRALEEDLDGRLIERLPRGIALTPAGRALLPEARAAVRAVERGRRGTRAALALEGGELEIATVLSQERLLTGGVKKLFCNTLESRRGSCTIRTHAPVGFLR
jgi:DNA-binding transcriptional LysR family regulator